MAYRKKTLRVMSPTARKVARLVGELESVATRFKNVIPDIQSLDLDSKALKKATQPIQKQALEPTDHYYFVLKNEPYDTWRIEEFWPLGKFRSPFSTAKEAIERERLIAEGGGFLDTLYLANADSLPLFE